MSQPPCKHCQQPIPWERLRDFGEPVAYCSPACSHGAKRGRAKEKYREKRGEMRKIQEEIRRREIEANPKFCRACKAPLDVEVLLRARQTQFCSTTCRKSLQVNPYQAQRRSGKPFICATCAGEIPKEIVEQSSRGPIPKYCSIRCKALRPTKRPGRTITASKLNSYNPVHGSLLARGQEFLVCYDLLKKHWQPYLSVMPNLAPVDLVAIHPEEGMKRIEVRKGRYKGQRLDYRKNTLPGVAHVYAIVTEDEQIYYFDEIPAEAYIDSEEAAYAQENRDGSEESQGGGAGGGSKG